MTVNAGTSLYYRQIRKQSQSTDGLIVAKVYNLGNSLNPVSATNSMNEKAIESVYGSVNVDLFESLFLTFTGRNDWSSTLAKGNNSYFYPSVSLSTLVNEYVKLPSWMDYLKVMVHGRKFPVTLILILCMLLIPMAHCMAVFRP